MILLAAPDESSLAAKKKQRHGALETATSTPKNRVWNFENTASGRTCSDPDLSWENATGSVQYSYKSASGRAQYYTRDHLGSVREMTDSSGTIQARYDYDPYGRATKVSGSMDSDFQYAGMYEHANSGLSLTMFRAYDPTIGRWLSRDPSGEHFGINLYRYCDNNPISLYDPFGLCPDLPDKWEYSKLDYFPPILYVHIFYNVGYNFSNYFYQTDTSMAANVALGQDMANNPALDPNNPNFNPIVIQQDQMQGIQNAAGAAVAGTQFPADTSFAGPPQTGIEPEDMAQTFMQGTGTDAGAQPVGGSTNAQKK